MAAIFGAVNYSSVHQAEVEEAQRDFEFEIQELLLTAGYFRARIANLSPFDKVIGGLAWSITASNVEVDIHLIYDEDANIGTKIKLSEAIEFALKRMKCPYPLQAHQIQGLDYPAVFPVVQWLVKKVLETRGEFGDRTRSYSHYVYSNVQGYKSLDPNEEPSTAAATRRNVEAVESSYRPQRRLRRARGAAAPAELSKRVRCVLLEYGHRFTGGLVMPTVGPGASKGAKGDAAAAAGKAADAAAAGGPVSQAQAARAAMAALNLADKFGGGAGAAAQSGPSAADSAAAAEAEAEKAAMEAAAAAMSEVDSGDVVLSGSMAARIVGMRSSEIVAAAQKFGETLDAGPAARSAFIARQIDTLAKQVAAEEARLAEAKAACADAEQNARTCEAAAAAVVAHNDRCVAESAKLDEFMASVDQKLVGRLMALVKESADLKTREASFKAECKKKLAELQAELARAADGESDFTPEELARITEVGQTFEAAKSRFDALRAQLAQRSMGVSLLSRKLDDVPTQPELLQYEKRFVELHETVQSKLEETRRYYAQYNTLADMKNYLTKEVSLLNSIRGQFEAAAKDSGVMGAFIKSTGEVDKGVAENLRRVDEKLVREQKRLAEVSEALTTASMHRRQYFAAVKAFQEECRKNDELRGKANAIRRQQQAAAGQ